MSPFHEGRELPSAYSSTYKPITRAVPTVSKRTSISLLYVYNDIVSARLYYVNADIQKTQKFLEEEMKTLDYVILAGLIRRPMSGYDLTKWIETETSHFFVIGHSSIYPALAQLEKEGLVEHEVVSSDKGPERKVYSLTERGRDGLLAWADVPAIERQTRDEQLVKALCYGYLPVERALARLEEEKARHEEKLAQYEEFDRELEHLLREGGISREAYLGTKLTLARGLGVEKSYVEWCEEAAGIISAAELDSPQESQMARSDP